MAKNKIKETLDFSEETVKRKRKFPTGKTVLLCVLAAAQLVMIGFMIFGKESKPQDVINEYNLTVIPLEDGSLDIVYELVWTPLDPNEPLTWVELGIANPTYTIEKRDLTGAAVLAYKKSTDDGSVLLMVDLDRAYMAGETLRFSVHIRQYDMLCRDGSHAFYEWVPGWFNYTPVEKYTVKWKNADNIVSSNATTTEGEWLVWEGSMECGSYVPIHVRYTSDSFQGARTVPYEYFDDSGVSDGLKDELIGRNIFLGVIVAVILVAEIYIVDCYVSYHRGRGFLRGYGYHVHIYGRSNPKYVSAQAAHQSKGGRGGGCACACACACAGGGRAGCSQKDGYRKKENKKESQ